MGEAEAWAGDLGGTKHGHTHEDAALFTSAAAHQGAAEAQARLRAAHALENLLPLLHSSTFCRSGLKHISC